MTIDTITAMLDTIATDSWYDIIDNHIYLTINDFEGFDDDWNEIEREYEDEEAVDNVLDWLKENADEITGDFYCDYRFGDIIVRVGYTSFDI